MRKLFPLLCLCLLLPARLAMAGQPERLDDVLRDHREHGIRSVSSAIDRLRHVSDLPGPDAPLEKRLRYHSALLNLSLASRQPAQVKASMAVLTGMANHEDCTRCRFDLLLARAELAVESSTPAAAKPYLDEAATLLPKLPDDGQAQEALLSTQSWVDNRDSRFNQGIELALQAYGLAAERHDEAEQIRLLASMIGMNADMGDPRRGAELGEEAYARAAAADYRAVMGKISLDLGHAYALMGDRPRQRATLERALALSEHDPDLVEIRILALNNLSDYYLSQPGQDRRVLDYARRADELARADGREIERAAPLANIGIALDRLGDVAGGIAHLQQAIDISERHGLVADVIGITIELVKAQEKAGRYREALALQHKVDTLQADLTEQEREKTVLDLQEKYAAARKSEQIAKLSAQNALKQAQLAVEAWRNRLWIALAAALALGLVALAQSIRRTREINRQLAVANASLAEQSMVDPLTGTFNRRHTQAVLERLQKKMPRRRTQEADATSGTGLLILDLDFFKRINDSCGHAAGDAVLVAVAERLRGLLRKDDVIARWGGEEFVLVLPHTRADALPAIASNVLHVIGGSPVIIGATAVDMTVSLGAISYPALPGQDWEAALGLADLALYQAKAGGRNRAFCITHVVAGADPEQLAHDLGMAQAAGDVELALVTGPDRKGTPPHHTLVIAAA